MTHDRPPHLLLTADGILDGPQREQVMVVSLGDYETGSEPEAFQCPGPVAEIRQASQQIYRVLDRARHHGGGTAGDVADLTSAGETLTAALFPAETHEHIASAASVTLQLSRKLLWIPWELAVVAGEALALRCELGRQLTETPQLGGPKPQHRAEIQIALIANPQFNLKEADREADELRQRFARCEDLPAPRIAAHEVTRGQLAETLTAGGWLHYAGHAESPATESPRLLLADGPLSAGEIAPLLAATPPRLVVANACESARLSEAQCTATGLAEAFLAAGAQHYIGTLAPVLDEAGLKFVTEFYEALLDGVGVGGSLLAARRASVAAAGQEALIWASYVLYGDPRSVLVELPGPAGQGSGESAATGKEPTSSSAEDHWQNREARQSEADLAEFQAHLDHEARVKDLLRQEELRDYESAAEARQWDRKSQESAKEHVFRQQALAGQLELERAAREAELAGQRERLDVELEEAARWGQLGLDLEAQQNAQQLELESRRLEALSGASLEALMAAAEDNQRAAILGELAKTRALAGRSLAEVLALADDRSPLVAEAIRERLQSEGDPQRVGEQRRLGDAILGATFTADSAPTLPPAESQSLRRLLGQAVLPAEAGSLDASSASTTRACPRCQNELPSAAQFCNQCGTRLA